MTFKTVGMEVFKELTTEERQQISDAVRHYRRLSEELPVGMVPFLPYHETLRAVGVMYGYPSSLLGRLILLHYKHEPELQDMIPKGVKL